MLYQQKEAKKCWENNISEWTGLKLSDALRKSKNGVKWRQTVTSVVPHRSMRSDISRASSFFFSRRAYIIMIITSFLCVLNFPGVFVSVLVMVQAQVGNVAMRFKYQGGEFVSLSPRKLKTFLNLAGIHQCLKVVHDNASYSSRNFKFTMLIIFYPKIHCLIIPGFYFSSNNIYSIRCIQVWRLFPFVSETT